MTKYEEHIAELCSKHKIKIKRSRGDNAVNMLSKIIWINHNIRSVKTYFGALHEIGHVVNEHPLIYFNMNRVLWNQSRSKSCVFVSKYRMQTETDAWKRAFDLAQWANFVADKEAVVSLLTYVYGYNESHRIPYKGIDNKMIKSVMQGGSNDPDTVLSLKHTLLS